MTRGDDFEATIRQKSRRILRFNCFEPSEYSKDYKDVSNGNAIERSINWRLAQHGPGRTKAGCTRRSVIGR